MNPRVALFAGVAAAVVLVDQLSKWWAQQTLRGEPARQVVGDLLRFDYLVNPGAAFGTGAGYTIVLSVIAIAVVAFTIVAARRLQDTVWAVALGLFLGGALGNLIDRLFRDPGFLRGHVVDFIDYNGWFVGNLADLALTVAAVLIVVRSWQGVRFDGS